MDVEAPDRNAVHCHLMNKKFINNLLNVDHFKKKRVPVVFGIEKEICTDNCYTYGYNDQYEEHEQHKTVDIVNLIGPK